MKKTLLLGLIIFLSINNIKADNTEYSNEIQDTFFGVKFGASKEEVKAAFLDRGFEIADEGLDAMLIENIPFGGYPWNSMLVQFINNRFKTIAFVIKLDRNSMITTEQEGNIFRAILSDLSKKYNMSVTKYNEDVIEYRADLKQKSVILRRDVKLRMTVLVYTDKTLGDNSDQF